MISAVIDIGTNTAHLLIAQVQNNQLIKSLHKRRQYTYLGEGGLHKILAQPLSRLIKALELFKEDIEKYKATEIRIIATDALRTASNGPDIQQQIRSLMGSQPTIISGVTEAKLIRMGVEMGMDIRPDNYLIMDIGGGSVEFIHVHQNRQVLLSSIPIGISRLHERCPEDVLLTSATCHSLQDHILQMASEVIASVRRYPEPLTLVGSAGTFEILLPQATLLNPRITQALVDLHLVRARHDEVVWATAEERASISWLPKVRGKYIVVAFILMQTVIDALCPSTLVVSKYSLKEGALIAPRSWLT